MQRKIIQILGLPRAGKTSLIKRLLYNEFDLLYTPTLGIEYYEYGNYILLDYSRLVSNIVLIVIDLSSKNCVSELQNIIDKYSLLNHEVIIVGNKCENKVCSYERIKMITLEYGFKYIEISVRKNKLIQLKRYLNDL